VSTSDPANAPYPYPGSAAAPHVLPLPLPSARRRSWRSTARAVALITLVTSAAGVPFGLVWAWLAPDIRVFRTDEGTYPVDPQPEQFIAADGWFALLGLGFGLAAAIAAWSLVRRHRGPVLLAAAALGALGAATVAWQVGRRLGLDAYERWAAAAAAGSIGWQPPDVRAPSVLLVPAFATVIMFTLLAGWSHDPDLGGDPPPERTQEYGLSAESFSSGSSDGPAPTTAPVPPVRGATTPPPG
jgi:Protein of unknown function (DUF2567)